VAEPRCTLARAFHRLTRLQPDAPALLGPSGEVLASRRDVLLEATRLAEIVTPFVAPGRPVVLSLPNASGLLPAFLALRQLGAQVALVDAAAPENELIRCSTTVGASAVLATAERLTREHVAWSRGAMALTVRYPEAAPALPPLTALLKLTSGSTGTPRAVALSMRQVVADSVQILRTMGIRPGDVTLAAIPLTHSYGLGSCLVPFFLVGLPLAFPTCSLPAALADCLVAARAAHFPAVPAMIRALATLPDLPRFPYMRVCLAAGAPLAPADAAAFHAATRVKVHVFYGSSECGGICYDRGDAPSHEPGAVGTAMDRVTVSILDDAERDLTTGAEGRVVVSSRAVALGTVPPLGDPRALTPGRFVTGDLGRLDADGRLTLTGRIAGFLNVAGKKVHPEEVRQVLEAVAGVRAAVVVSLPDRHRGEMVGAVVAVDPASGLTVRALLTACRGSLAPHKVPRRLAIVAEIPMSDRGKVRVDALVDLLAGAAAGSSR